MNKEMDRGTAASDYLRRTNHDAQRWKASNAHFNEDLSSGRASGKVSLEKGKER